MDTHFRCLNNIIDLEILIPRFLGFRRLEDASIREVKVLMCGLDIFSAFDMLGSFQPGQ